jgi:hypothetical protein
MHNKWGDWNYDTGKFVIYSSKFKDFKCSLNYLDDDGNFGFLNESTGTDYKYHLWFVPSDTIFQNLYNELFLRDYLNRVFPTAEETWNNEKLWIVIDRRMESLDTEGTKQLLNQCSKYGYNIDRIKFFSNSYFKDQSLLINFPFEFYQRTLRFKLSDEEFGERLRGRDIAINYEFEGHSSDYKKWLLNLDNVESRPYTFLSYAGSLPSHKLLLLSELYRRKLDKYCLISALNRDDDDINTLRERVREFQPNGVKGLDESKILDMLPIYLDIDRELSKNETVGYDVSLPDGEGSSEIGDSQPKKHHHNQTYFYLANETSFDCARITSHIKSVILHPMIFNAGAGTLELFKSWGFKSFPNIFDESYDEIEDDIERHKFLVKEIERVCLLPEEEKHKLYLESIPTIKYNQKVFINFDVENMVLDMFNKIVS